MGKYTSDREFTDYVHKKLCIPLIYGPLNWHIKYVNPQTLKFKDMHLGIDYILNNSEGREITVQERFREQSYKYYSDATLRFRREANAHEERIESEFYKIKADYLVYGITNGSKSPDKRDQLTGFLKWVVLDLAFLRWKFEVGELCIHKTRKRTCSIDSSRLICPENFNPDGSSSFVPFDIKMIVELWGKAPIIAQNGFL